MRGWFSKEVDLGFSYDGMKIKIPKIKGLTRATKFSFNIDNHLNSYGIQTEPTTITIEFWDQDGNYHSYTKERRGNKLIDIYGM